MRVIGDMLGVRESQVSVLVRAGQRQVDQAPGLGMKLQALEWKTQT